MSSSSILLAIAGAALLLGLGAVLQLLRLRRRGALLQDLHALADAQETALRALRAQLASAHAEIITLTDQPTPHADEAAFAAALREQLAHRLWLRDHAARAPLPELRKALRDWRNSARALSDDAAALRAAQHALARASRQGISPDP
ncbi:hypothetical protein [Metallibacterium sp.]|uniref:hypothetical protein n=1 Tax=Metallibacterium sp. TaxID=2940281 RepID=UPI00261121E8|nr:hypothetical protein [Metallibacterium sp.]